MDYSKLNPLVATYSQELSDQDVADALNAKTVRRRILADKGAVKEILYPTPFWEAITGDKGTDDYFKDSDFEHINLDLPKVQALMAGLVAAGVPTAVAEAIDALGWEMVSIAEQNGLETVGDGHVKSARKLNANG
jgi:hypothetical protein